MAATYTTVSPLAASGYILIDVLPQERYTQVHLPGAHNACVYEVTFIDQVRSISHDPEACLLLYGDSAASNEAHCAADKLARAGYRCLAILEGGLQTWRDAGLPLETAPTTHDTPQQQPQLPPGRYAPELTASRIGWTGRNANGSHRGTLSLAGGELLVTDAEIEGHFEIDLHSIDNLDLAGNPLKEVLLKHLLSDDFLFAERYPTATFTLASAHPIPGATASQPNYHLRGELSLRGLAHPFDFPATLNAATDGSWLAEAHFDLDRTRWDIVYGSNRFFAYLGKHQVFDPVSIEIVLQLMPLSS